MLCTAINFDFTFSTATYCYILQLEMHVRLICVIKFYLHTYLLNLFLQLCCCLREFRTVVGMKIPVDMGKKGKGSPYSITVPRVSELIPVLGSQPAGYVSHKPGCRLPLVSAS